LKYFFRIEPPSPSPVFPAIALNGCRLAPFRCPLSFYKRQPSLAMTCFAAPCHVLNFLVKPLLPEQEGPLVVTWVSVWGQLARGCNIPFSFVFLFPWPGLISTNPPPLCFVIVTCSPWSPFSSPFSPFFLVSVVADRFFDPLLPPGRLFSIRFCVERIFRPARFGAPPFPPSMPRRPSFSSRPPAPRPPWCFGLTPFTYVPVPLLSLLFSTSRAGPPPDEI